MDTLLLLTDQILACFIYVYTVEGEGDGARKVEGCFKMICGAKIYSLRLLPCNFLYSRYKSYMKAVLLCIREYTSNFNIRFTCLAHFETMCSRYVIF